jgi:hypothetical protein
MSALYTALIHIELVVVWPAARFMILHNCHLLLLFILFVIIIGFPCREYSPPLVAPTASRAVRCKTPRYKLLPVSSVRIFVGRAPRVANGLLHHS